MEFSVGDKVMHPNFGAGQITGEQHRDHDVDPSESAVLAAGARRFADGKAHVHTIA